MGITVSRINKSGEDEYLKEDSKVMEFDSKEEAVSHLIERGINSKIIATFNFHKGRKEKL